MIISEENRKRIDALKGELSATGKYQRCAVCHRFILVPRLDNHIMVKHREEMKNVSIGEKV